MTSRTPSPSFRRQDRRIAVDGERHLAVSITSPHPDGTRSADATPIPADAPVALLAHCFTCHRRSPGVSRIAEALTRAGWTVVRPDFRGLGQSDGDFADATLRGDAADLLALTRALEVRPRLWIGHSLGGCASVLAAASWSQATGDPAAIVTIGSPSDPRTTTRAIAPFIPLLAESPEARVPLPGRGIALGRAFVDDLRALAAEAAEAGAAGGAMGQALAQLASGSRLCVMHSRWDQTVPYREALRWKEASPIPTTVAPIDYADHLLTRRGAAGVVGATIAGWAAAIGR